MRRKKLLTGVLTAALLVGSISPVGVVGAELPEEVLEEQLTISETELQEESEDTITVEEEVKSVEADENGFVIEEGVLIDYTGDGGNVTIPNGVTSIGNNAFYDCSSLTSISIPSSVTSIGDSAFYDCSGLTSITIPKSVTSIGDSVFAFCSSLTEIDVSEENENYTSEDGILYDADKSTLICCPAGKTGNVTTIPDSVTNIGDKAFYDCKELTGITIPSSVTSIGNNAFTLCYNLTGITIPSSVTSIGDSAFTFCNRLTEINVSEENKNYTSENGILYDVSKSTLICCPKGKTGEITIPDSVTSVEGGAFSDCSRLTSITIPDSVTNISDYTFASCDGLTSITIPDSVTSIGYFAFGYCGGLTSITIPNSVTSIDVYAFYGCSALTEINVSEENKNYTSENGILYDTNKSTLICYPGGKTGDATNIPDSVTSIGGSAFAGCDNLTSITIPNSVTSIGDSAFANCDNLTSITIPGSVTSIGDYAFEDCDNLTSITIPSSVTSIGYCAFRLCDKLIIFCEKDSYAETYAKENNIKYKYIGEKDGQTISIASDNITKTFGDSAFSVGAATDGDGVLSYVSDNEAVAKVDSVGNITLVGAGTAHITITASETNTYKAAEKVITITVEKKAQTITASDVAKTFGDAAFSLNAKTDGDGTLTYVCDDTSVATVDASGMVTLVNAGTAHIAIKASETTNYKAAEKVITVTVNPSETSSETSTEETEKKEQTITAKNITKTYGDKAFSLGAKTNGGGKLTYKVSNTKIATIDKNGKVTIKGCGITQIKITAAAKGNYKKTTKTITLTVKPKKAAVTSVKSTKSKALTVKWKQDKTAKGYIIQYSTDKNFKKNVNTVTVSKNKTTSKTISKLKGGKKYYVRVCAYTTADGKKIKGNYSKVLNVKVKK